MQGLGAPQHHDRAHEQGGPVLGLGQRAGDRGRGGRREVGDVDAHPTAHVFLAGEQPHDELGGQVAGQAARGRPSSSQPAKENSCPPAEATMWEVTRWAPAPRKEPTADSRMTVGEDDRQGRG